MSLVRLTAAKSVANTALRWVPPFLPELEDAFGTSTRQMTTIIGAGEMAGLSTVAAGRFLNRGRARAVMTFGLTAIAVASLVSLIGTTFTFGVGFVLVVIGVSNCTVAGHAEISHSVPYVIRARAIGLFETSWALALLIGAPLIAVLISEFGWRGPFGFLAVASALSAVMILRAPAPSAASPTEQVSAPATSEPASIRALGLRAWGVIIGSAALAMAGLSVYAISGSWLDTAFEVKTAGLGAVAMGFGAIELVASTSSAGLADRLGKFRSTMTGTALMLGGGGIMAIAGSSLLVGVLGLLVFLGGFEFAFVTSLSLVTEATPLARGTTIALASAVGTVARGSGTIASGWLFDAHGVRGTLGLSLVAAAVATTAFVISRRARA